MTRQRHDGGCSTFRSHAFVGGADERDLEPLAHPSPRSASDVSTRAGVTWPRACRAVRAVRVPGPRTACTARVRTERLLAAENAPIPSDPQGNREPGKNGRAGESKATTNVSECASPEVETSECASSRAAPPSEREPARADPRTDRTFATLGQTVAAVLAETCLVRALEATWAGDLATARAFVSEARRVLGEG